LSKQLQCLAHSFLSCQNIGSLKCQNVHLEVLGKKYLAAASESKHNYTHKTDERINESTKWPPPSIIEPTLPNIVLYHDHKPNTFTFPDYDHEWILMAKYGTNQTLYIF